MYRVKNHRTINCLQSDRFTAKTTPVSSVCQLPVESICSRPYNLWRIDPELVQSVFASTSRTNMVCFVYDKYPVLLSTLSTAQPVYLHNLISVQPPGRTPHSFVISHHHRSSTIIFLSQNHKSLFPICITQSLE